MESQKNKVSVVIYGETYPLKGDADPGKIEQVAAFVDERMQETAQGNFRLPPEKVAILAALNIADELLRLQADYRKLVELVNRSRA